MKDKSRIFAPNLSDMTLLLADSGSTKTDWLLLRQEGDEQRITTAGLNPFHTPTDDMTRILRNDLLLSLEGCVPDRIYFYGSGCTSAKSLEVQHVLHTLWPQLAAHNIEVHGDLLGAARALCGHDTGIACILGTGANSCYYDGKHITMNVPPLGYILGDEGSGAYIGKRFVGDCLKGLLPETVYERFKQHTGLTYEAILNKIYREPQANRFLAGLAPFIAEVRNEPSVHQLLVDCFTAFVKRNLTPYPSREVHAVGSIAYYFKDELREALAAYGYTCGRVQRSPMDGLKQYHVADCRP